MPGKLTNKDRLAMQENEMIEEEVAPVAKKASKNADKK